MNTDAETHEPGTTGMATDHEPRSSDGQRSSLPPPPPASPRRLVRSDDRRIGGVAGGVAAYFDIDPVIVRLAFVIAVFAGGTGLIAYLIAWMVIPDSDGEPQRGSARGVDRSTILALALLAVAAAIGISDFFDGGVVTPLVLIAAGIYLLHQRPLDREPQSAADVAAPARDDTTILVSDTTGGADDQPIPAWQPGDGRPPPPPTDPPARPSDGEQREPAIITRFALSLVSLWLAAAIAADALDWLEADASTVVAVALVIVGVAGIAAGLFGGGRGLIPVGILLSLTFAAALVIEPVLENGVGEREHAIADPTELEPAYRLGIGELIVDLSELDLAPGETATVEVELGIGRAEVLLPPDVDVQLEGDVGIGELVMLDQTENGIRNELDVDRDTTDTAPTVIIDLSVGIGSGVIERG